MPLPGGAIAHVHVNWLSPTKIRNMVIGGSRRTLVWDDLNPQQRLSVYDRGVDLNLTSMTEDLAERRSANISYRLGDMYAPSLPEGEALGAMVTEFAAAITEQRAPLTDGESGLRVLRVLEAATASLGDGGRMMGVGGSAHPADDANSAPEANDIPESNDISESNGANDIHELEVLA